MTLHTTQNAGNSAPASELERKLLDAKNGKPQVEALMRELVASQVYILMDKNPRQSGAWDHSTSPLILSSSGGIPVLAVFTNPGHALAWNTQYPKYDFTMQVDFAWLLKGVADGVGVAINPGSPDGMEIAPSGVEQLKKDAP